MSLAYYLKKSGRKAAITATDISHEALKIAEENAMINGVAKQVCFAEGDLFEPFRKGRKGRGRVQFNLIVCNPPYIPTGTLDSLMREVREHEPLNALDGGADGMDFYRRILKRSPLHLQRRSAASGDRYDQGKWNTFLQRRKGLWRYKRS